MQSFPVCSQTKFLFSMNPKTDQWCVVSIPLKISFIRAIFMKFMIIQYSIDTDLQARCVFYTCNASQSDQIDLIYSSLVQKKVICITCLQSMKRGDNSSLVPLLRVASPMLVVQLAVKGSCLPTCRLFQGQLQHRQMRFAVFR